MIALSRLRSHRIASQRNLVRPNHLLADKKLQRPLFLEDQDAIDAWIL